MKDITVKQQKRELKYLLIAFLAAETANLFSIIYYHTDFRELYTQILWTLILTAVIYLCMAAVRIIIRQARLMGRKSQGTAGK
jgi:hypothetical protein